jgi:hypothetical protein
MTDISPELAMVDPGLRSEALAELPPLEAFDFLRFERWPEKAEAVPWRPPLLVAASVYAASSLARVVVMDGLFVLVLAAAVGVLNLFG